MSQPAKKNRLGRRLLGGLLRCERGDSVLTNVFLTMLGMTGVAMTIDPFLGGLKDVGSTFQDQAHMVRNGATGGSTSGFGGGGSGMDFGSAISGVSSAVGTITDLFTKFEDAKDKFEEKQEQKQQQQGGQSGKQ